MSDGKKVKWGVLGTANIADYGTIPGMKLAPSCELYAIAGRRLEKAQAYKDKFGFEKAYGSYDELLADPEVQAVYVPLPNDIHKKWVIEALRHGKHVLCEKPLAMNAKEVEEMFAAAEENNVFLMEAYAYLHSPYVESLKNDVASGIIGEVDYVDTAFVTQGYTEDFRLHKEFGGGAMYDLGCYCTTMILSLIDSDPEFVKASAEFSDEGAGQEGSGHEGVDLSTAAIIRFKNGARASFQVGMILDQTSNSRFDRLYVHGSKGSIRSDVEYNQEGEVSYTIHTKDGQTIERKIFVPQNYSLEIEQLSRCILGEAVPTTPAGVVLDVEDGEGAIAETPLVSKAFSLKNMRLMDRIFEEIGY